MGLTESFSSTDSDVIFTTNRLGTRCQMCGASVCLLSFWRATNRSRSEKERIQLLVLAYLRGLFKASCVFSVKSEYVCSIDEVAVV